MGTYLEEQIVRVEAILDVLDGQAYEPSGRDGTFGSASSGPGPAGFEPCLGCADNVARLGYCPACDNTGWTRSGLRGKSHDPYLSRVEEPVESVELVIDRSPPAIYAGEVTSENLPRLLEKSRRQAGVEPPPTREYVRLTPVERAVAAHDQRRYRESIAAVSSKLADMGVEGQRAAFARERWAVEYIAKRVPRLYIPGE